MSAPPAPAGQRPGADEAEAAASAAEKVPDPEVVSEARNVISSFLRRVEVYDVMPDSAKVVVFDINIPVRLAFYALVEHELNCAPVWDAERQEHVCMFTVSDFISILRHFHRHALGHEQFARLNIEQWRAMRQREGLTRDIGAVQLPSGTWLDYSRGLRFVTPTASLYDAVSTLTRFRIHRLPVFDPDQNCIVSICTHMHVLQYLVLRFREQRRLFDHGIRALGIGTFGRIVTASEGDSLVHVLDLMSINRVSGVPVIDSSGAVTDVYMRHYIIHMARERSPTAHLHTPVGALLRDWNELCDMETGMQTCRATDTLHSVFAKFATAKTTLLVCVGEDGELEGVVSISDLLAYFLDEKDQEEVDYYPGGGVPAHGAAPGAAPGSNGGDEPSSAAAAAPAPSAHTQGAGAAAASDVVLESGGGGDRDRAGEPSDHGAGHVAPAGHDGSSGEDAARGHARPPPAEPPGDGGDVYEVDAEQR